MADTRIIEAADLHKHYASIAALRGLSLEVSAGSIYGVLGKNAAGKTTAMKVLLGMTRPTSGRARVFGLDAADPNASVEIRRRTGFVSEEKDLYDYMTVEETVRFTASFFPRWRQDLESHYLRAFELPGERKVKALSRGMRTKLMLLLALCRGPELLLLGEPTSGLDPAVTEEVLQAIVSHVARLEGQSIPLTLTRIGPPRMKPAPRITTIPSRLEGTWNATVSGGGRDVHLVLMLVNYADGTCTGSLVNLDEGRLTVPVTAVDLREPVVTIAFSAIGGSFTGSTNTDGTEVTGTFTQGSFSMPATFRHASR